MLIKVTGDRPETLLTYERDGNVRSEQSLRKRPGFKVVVSPDFYLDYLISYPGELADFTREIADVAGRGGGNILGWKHTVGRGGNACNLVAQLAKLRVDVVPIIETDEMGYSVLERSLRGVDLSHVRTDGTLSSTLSLEITHSGRRVNIMASNPGSHSTFGPEKLTKEDMSLIQTADFVCVVNWAKNQRGTDLAETVFQLARRGKAVTFFDPADPSMRRSEIPELRERVLASGLVDVLSVNENELLQLSHATMEKLSQRSESSLFEAAAAVTIAGVRVDLHTLDFSATFHDSRKFQVPCLKFEPVKVTGAGDMWNGADIYAQGMGLDDEERLVFANAAAAAYLRQPGFEPPSLEEILKESEEVEKVSGH